MANEEDNQRSNRHANTLIQDILKPGSCGGAQLEQVLSDIRLLRPQESDETLEEKKRAHEILTKYESEPARATWSDLYEAQRIRQRLLPTYRLEMEMAALRSQFQLVAGPTLSEKYKEALQEMRSRSGKSDSKERNEELLRAEAAFLLAEAQYIETYRPHQERKRLIIGYNTLCVTLGMVCGFALLSLAYALLIVVANGEFANGETSWIRSVFNSGLLNEYPLALLLICAFGSMGACLSSIVRLQESFKEGRMILNSTRYLRKVKDYLVPPFSGAVFAVLLTLFFYSGVSNEVLPPALQGLAPKISPPATKEEHKNKLKTDVALNSGREIVSLKDLVVGNIELANLAKILIFAFIAGFAERLVPDTLDRLIGGKVPNKKKEAQNVAPTASTP